MLRRTIAKPLCVALAATLAPGMFSGASAATAPRHVMSLFLCSDQLVLDLLPRERIASVSYFAVSPAYSYRAEEAAHVPVNYATAEEVLQQQPDLVIAGQYTNAATRAIIKKTHIPLLELPPANSFEDIRAVTLQVGRALGAEVKAESLIARMDATLAELAATAPKRPITIAAWEGSGEVPSKGSLFDAIVTAAGATNIAAQAGDRSGSFDIERLLVARPDILAFGDSLVAMPARANDRIVHPVVQAAYRNREIAYPELLYACGLPESADAAKALRDQMLDITNANPRAQP